MMLFIDASALVAILTEEAEASAFEERLTRSPAAMTSPLAIFEASQAVARKTDGDLDAARKDVIDFLEQAGIETISINASDGVEALVAHRRFGKGRHPASLNMGDCFAYACAKRLGAALLFKGDDFPQTDIKPALVQE